MNYPTVKPQYNNRCFADLPSTILHLLTGHGQPALNPEIMAPLAPHYERIIFLLLDNFGWQFFQQAQDQYPFLQRFTNEGGHVAQLTAQFPSTTAAEVTTIHTGLPVAQSGVYEWQYYEPHLDTLIAPLLHAFAGRGNPREQLAQLKINPEILYPASQLYPRLQQHGVQPYLLQRAAYAHSTYSQRIFQGAKIVPYYTFSEALVNLRLLLENPDPLAYYFLYFEQVDSISHAYGPDSPYFAAELDSMLTILERQLGRFFEQLPPNTLLMVTADHGQIGIDPQATCYLNLQPRFKGLEQFLKRNQHGNLLVPAGSPRDMFLYIKEPRLDEAAAFLTERLAGQATIHKTADLLAAGYFGPQPPSAAFRARVGNLVILPHPDSLVWWYIKDTFEVQSHGHHGGLTPAEMEIPLLMYEFC